MRACMYVCTSNAHTETIHACSGFESVSIYGSGSFDMRIKAPDNNSTGVITSFYLTSRSSRHDEVSFQLLGSNRPPYMLNTNMILYGEGGKDQMFRLWFDPTKDYHSYRFLWNPRQLVFYVDNTPIRVFKKNPGVYYLSVQTMFVMGSVTSQKGVTIDPKQTPYTAWFQASKIEGCITTFFNIERCIGPEFWWNRAEFSALNPREKELYRNARKTYLDYDYCSDRARYPREPPECRIYEQ
ncbi:PREDICTED: probable xyloglucan endotransglucosylase/hydrolase protein 11 isoform X2 [Tarenaya hassleriana]|uniref:probable xyloglucan endotransglucosylase/hydrolase protein 11 isoform X2 n=1 Tax=Tarenaya hassleriana TaxID=28532 RepID=UPI00053C433E|nr:PREDICTED: probable xyloglucan endotransglucosylase/hydrolase protein 11 isoform X2 [Tarenaya hassleriana]